MRSKTVNNDERKIHIMSYFLTSLSPKKSKSCTEYIYTPEPADISSYIRSRCSDIMNTTLGQLPNSTEGWTIKTAWPRTGTTTASTTRSFWTLVQKRKQSFILGIKHFCSFFAPNACRKAASTERFVYSRLI